MIALSVISARVRLFSFLECFYYNFCAFSTLDIIAAVLYVLVAQLPWQFIYQFCFSPIQLPSLPVSAFPLSSPFPLIVEDLVQRKGGISKEARWFLDFHISVFLQIPTKIVSSIVVFEVHIFYLLS